MAVITILALFLLTFLYPFQTTTVPHWDLRVVDDAGVPVREINVTEHWQNYLLESEGHEEARITDQNGMVGFGLRSIRASVARRLFARLSKFGSNDAQGRIDRYGAVVVWGSKSYETTVAVYREEDSPAEIRVQRLR